MWFGEAATRSSSCSPDSFATSEAITVDTTELDDARWFTREEMVAGLLSGSFLLPRSLSISFRLIEDWFDAGRADGHAHDEPAVHLGVAEERASGRVDAPHDRLARLVAAAIDG